jgi:hypothetical protein
MQCSFTSFLLAAGFQFCICMLFQDKGHLSFPQLLTFNPGLCDMGSDNRFSSYVEKSAWDPSVYVNTPVVFGAKSYVSPGQPVPIASGSPAFGFALRVIVERPAKLAKYARFVCMF